MAMLSHRQGWSFNLAFLVFPFVFFSNRADDQPVATYRAETSEVRISFFATDERNRPVDVGRDDFAVVDNGIVVRDFRSLTRAAETGLDVIAVVDASESVQPRFRNSIQDVLHLLSHERRRGDDRFSVILFSGLRPELLCAGNCHTALIGQLQRTQATGATPLFDALTDAAHLAAKRQQPGVRPVLILFSDGHDTISRTSAKEALGAIIASSALLYSVDLNRPGSAPEASATLLQMSEATGGRVIAGEAGGQGALDAALADLHASYAVTYQLPNRATGFHSLRLLPKHNLNLHFHCRSGYYYEERTQ